MFDNTIFNPLKKLLQDAAAQVGSRKTDLENLRRQREIVSAAPTSRSDALKAITARIDSEAARHLRVFSENLTSLVVKGDPARITCPILAAAKSEVIPSIASIEAGIYMALGDEIKASAARVISAMAWPTGSLDAAEKTKQVMGLDKKIAALESELAAIAHSARDAGLSI